jgi:hypothetical protein
LTE